MSKSPQAQKLDRMIECYKNGYADVEICRELDMTMAEFEHNIQNSQVFAKLVETGRILSKAWWYSAGRENLNNKGFNTPLWGFNMKNRFGWADKVEQTSGDNTDNLTEDQIAAKLRKLKEQLIRQAQKDATESTILGLTSEPN